jgi:hypothetical protein
MGRKITKDFKKHRAEHSRHVKDLENEKYKLEFLRDCPYLIEAITIFLVKSRSLTDEDEEKIRKAMEFLSKGPK